MPLIVLLFAVGVVGHFAWLLALFAAAATVGRLVGGILARADDRQLERRRRAAEIRARADRQHAAVLAGDDRGVYGDYPPAAAP